MAKKNVNIEETTATNTEQTAPENYGISVVLVISPAESAELVELSVKKWRENFADHNADGLFIIGGQYSDIQHIDYESSTDTDVNLANQLAAIVADEPAPVFRDMFPFLNEPNTPAELKILAADKITAYRKMLEAHRKLFDCTSIEQCYRHYFSRVCLRLRHSKDYHSQDEVNADLDKCIEIINTKIWKK